MKWGIVDAGGGLRGIYACGVMDTCLESDVHFDLCIGVSAGSANMASFLGGQKGRNYQFYHEYAFRREYMSMHNLVHTGSYIDLQYVYGTLSNAGGENPLDYAAIVRNPARFLIVAENALSGEARYFEKSDLAQDDYRAFMASSCIPAVNRPYVIDGTPYFDGALADPVPVKKALDEGCDRVVVLLTKPADVPREPGNDPLFARMIRRRYPRSAQCLLARAQRYNDSVELAKQLQSQGRALIIAPDNTEGVRTLTRDKDALDRLYQKGRRDGRKVVDFVNASC